MAAHRSSAAAADPGAPRRMSSSSHVREQDDAPAGAGAVEVASSLYEFPESSMALGAELERSVTNRSQLAAELQGGAQLLRASSEAEIKAAMRQQKEAEAARKRTEPMAVERREKGGKSSSDARSSYRSHDDAKRDLEAGVPTGEKGEEEQEAEEQPTSAVENVPKIVGWEGPMDPANPKNWSFGRRWAATSIVSFYTFISPLASSMVAPAVPEISKEFGVTSTVKQSLMVSVFVLAYAVGPLFLGPLSEIVGRRPILQGCNIFFLAFNIACSRAQTFSQMAAFRFLAGLGGSAPLAVGGGTLSDLWTAEERGMAMAFFSLAPLAGPVIGPIAGGWIAQSISWRWIFYISTIAGAAPAIAGLFLLKETYAPVILEKKARRLRNETGNEELRSVFDKGETVAQLWRRSLGRPIIMLTTQPIVMVLSAYMAVLYGTMYLLLVTFPSVFQTIYHERPGIASLNYISLGIGFTSGGQLGARLLDRIYIRLKKQNGGVGQPEMRLVMMKVTSFFIPAGMLLYGWTAEYHKHWIAPNIGAAMFGFGMMGSFLCTQAYLVDAYTLYAASAVAAASSLRSCLGFGFPLFAPDMYAKLGFGWGNSVLALIAFVIGVPAPFLIYRYGARLRALSTYATSANT